MLNGLGMKYLLKLDKSELSIIYVILDFLLADTLKIARKIFMAMKASTNPATKSITLINPSLGVEIAIHKLFRNSINIQNLQ